MRYKPRKKVGGVTYYQCNRCKEWFPENDFYTDKRSPLGITSSCKKCHCQTTIETRDKDRAREANKMYMRRKSEKRKAQYIVLDSFGEEWMPIDGLDGYFISNKGRVKSVKWGKEILRKQHISEKGYMQVRINNKTFRIHRLVAKAFLDNTNGYDEINHKDENKTNNVVSNLEWCDRKYNMNYGTWKERRKAKFGH